MSRRLKITFLIPAPDLSGGFRVIAEFAEHLTRRGHVVTIVAQGYGPPLRFRSRCARVLRSLLGIAGPVFRPPSHFDNRGLNVSIIDERRPIRESDVPDADVIITTWWETAKFAAEFSPAKGVKVQFIQQYEANFGFPESDVDATWRLPAQKIVCSQWLADFACTRFDDSSAIVVKNGIDLGLFDAPERGKSPSPCVGAMYAPSPAKSWATTLGVLLELYHHNPRIQFEIFGAHHPTVALPLPPNTNFYYRPPQTQLREIYAKCDLWICGSSSEGFHLPPHEAMACRCPVVSTRVGGPMDMIVQGVNGYLAEPFDVCGLARHANAVLSLSESDWLRMSDAAYESARRETWENATDQFEAALNVCVAEKLNHDASRI